MVVSHPPPTLQEIEEVDWHPLAERLLLYAAARLKTMYWRGQPSGVPPGGVEPQDFVLGAIRKYLNHERKKPEGVALFPFLCGVIRSDISHLSTSEENKRTVSEGINHIPHTAYRIEEAQPLLTTSNSTPYDEIAMKQEREQLLSRLGGDPLMQQVASMIVDEGMKPKEIATSLQRPVKDVYNAIKRLRRLMCTSST